MLLVQGPHSSSHFPFGSLSLKSNEWVVGAMALARVRQLSQEQGIPQHGSADIVPSSSHLASTAFYISVTFTH